MALIPPTVVIIATLRIATRAKDPWGIAEEKREHKEVKVKTKGWLALGQPGPTEGELSFPEEQQTLPVKSRKK